MADSTEPKPKRTLTPEQIAKMQAAKKAKKAEREAAKAAAETLVEMKHSEDKTKKPKKSKKVTEETEKKPSAWDKLTPEQKAERLAKMKAGKEAKKKEKTD
jgi:hypothetical protein